MYFHPLILTEAQKEQRRAAYEDFARLWLAGIERQYRLHVNAVNEFRSRHQEGAKAMFEAMDLAKNALAHWSALAAPMPLELLRISMRSGEIAADVHREITTVAERHVNAVSRIPEVFRPGSGSPVRFERGEQDRAARRRQVMA
jgi:hypothetical protein